MLSDQSGGFGRREGDLKGVRRSDEFYDLGSAFVVDAPKIGIRDV